MKIAFRPGRALWLFEPTEPKQSPLCQGFLAFFVNGRQSESQRSEHLMTDPHVLNIGIMSATGPESVTQTGRLDNRPPTKA